MYQFWKNNKNVISVGLSLFVVSVTALMILLNNESLSSELKTSLVHDSAGEAHGGEEIEYGPYLQLEDGPALIVGLDGMIEMANEKYGETTQFSPEEVQGHLFFNYVHPEDLAGVLSAYGKVLSSGEPEMLVGPFRMKNADGLYSVQMAAMQPVMAEGKMSGVAVKTQKLDSGLIPSGKMEIEYEEINDESEDAAGDDEKVDEESEDAADDNEKVEDESESADDEENTAESENSEPLPPRNEKQIRNESDQDKRLVVNNLAKVINKVYRDPDVLAYLF